MATYLEYLDAAMKRAEVERMENGKYFATIQRFEGVWGVGDSPKAAKEDLRYALDGWIDVQIKIGKHSVPDIDGVSLSAPPKLVED